MSRNQVCLKCGEKLPIYSGAIFNHYRTKHPEYQIKHAVMPKTESRARPPRSRTKLECQLCGVRMDTFKSMLNHFHLRHGIKDPQNNATPSLRVVETPTSSGQSPKEEPKVSMNPPELVSFINWLTARYQILETNLKEAQERLKKYEDSKFSKEFWDVYEDYRTRH